MPPKKVQEPEKKPLIGRVGTNLKVGIVGVPNVGKSTFFNVLTKSSAAAENFPFCTIDPNENNLLEKCQTLQRRLCEKVNLTVANMTDFYLRNPNEDITGCNCIETIITRKRCLKHLTRIKYTEEEPVVLPQILDWYPLANSYYAYTEDVDAYARVNHLLSTKPSFESITSLSHCKKIYEGNVYSEREAQIQYLSSIPTSFLILGKPCVGEEELGRLIADFWKCVYIDPEILITEEIQSDSRAGQCIEFNLRCGRAVGVDVIMRLMTKRVKSKTAQHRGFVICGFPLIPNDLYEEDPLSSESAVFNVKEIFDEIVDVTVEIGIPPPTKPKPSKIHFKDDDDESSDESDESSEKGEEETVSRVKLPPADAIPLDLGSTMSNMCVHGDYEKNYEEQVDFIFTQFSTPFILIYMMCSNTDVINRRKDCCFEYYTRSLVDLQREYSDKMVYTLFSKESHDEPPEDIIDVIKNNTILFDSSQPRLLLRLPRNFPANVATLLDRYRYTVLPIIERHVLVHNREYLIKVDGRISPVRMFNAVKMKLRVLPLQKVVIPQKCLTPPEPGLEGEGAGEMLDIEGLSHAECFEIFKRRQIASTMFKWGWSDWGIKCPVSMKEGTYLDGDPKFAVQFMNKIFFLSDQDAYLKFYRNPRPYLLPPFPKPSCKIFVIGPRCSGKSAVAKCLAYLLKGEVLDFQELKMKFLKLKQDEYLEKIRNAALQEGVVLLDEKRENEWNEAELDRQLKADEWLEDSKTLLENIITIVESYPTKVLEKMYRRYLGKQDEPEAGEEEKVVDLDIDLFSSFPISLSHSKAKRGEEEAEEEDLTPAMPEEIMEAIKEFQILINFDGLPNKSHIRICKALLGNLASLLEKLPLHLHPPKEKVIEPATIFDDFVVDYANQAVNNASLDHIHLTTDHVIEMLSEEIKQVEDKNDLLGETKGGWIIDGIPVDVEIFEKMLELYIPTDIFVLKDEPEHQFLLERFHTRGLNEFRDYNRFFMEIGKPDAAYRSPSLVSTESYKARTMADIMADVLDDTFFAADQNVEEPTPEEENDPYFRKHPRTSAVEEYIKDLNKFDVNWETLLPTLTEYNISIVELMITDKSFYTLLKELVKGIDDRFRQLPVVFTDDDKIQELHDFGEPGGQGEELGEGEEKGSEDTFFQNRRFGDTFNYCPVIFHDNFVLWKGKEEFTVKFEEKLYLLSTEAAMGNFLEDPRKYLLGDRPPENFPPPRICVVGVNGIGKTTVSRALQKNIGVFYKSIELILHNYLAPKSTFSVKEILEMGISEERGDIISKYLDADEPIVEQIWMDLFTPLWLENPVKTFGFVFDGFPKRPSDVKYMIQRGIVPDIVVELIMGETELYNRLTAKFIENWEKMQAEKLERLKQQRFEIFTAWEEAHAARFNELMEGLKEERYNAECSENEGSRVASKTRSHISFTSTEIAEDIEVVNRILEEELPPPVFVEEEEIEESLEEAVEKFSQGLEEAFTKESQYLQASRELCDIDLIPWVTIDAGMSEDKVFAQLMRAVDQYKFRNQSVFERVYMISVDLADRLLSNGYYFLSKFGKSCPVQIYEKINPIQMFVPLEEKFQLFPAVHRQYIYFLGKKESFDKFKLNPLLYTQQSSCGFPLIPLRLAIIGPPKSGKTALAERFKRDLGMQVVSRGKAARYVLEYLEFSDLAINMEAVLHCGWELTNEMVAKCVEAATFDARSITQGFVMDGFPCSIEESRHLLEVGLIPQLVIDLQAEHVDVFEFLGYCEGKRHLPVYSPKFIDHRLEEWMKTSESFRQWYDDEYQGAAKIFVKPSMWGVWVASFEYTAAALSEIQQYYKLCKCDVALRLGYMQVTPLEFIQRQSMCYRSYCPCCLFFENALNNGGEPPDRTGVVQFRKYFYYICNEHIELFVEDPEKFIPPYSPYILPPDLPIRIYITEVPVNVYEDGLCIICYWDNQPLIVLNQGVPEFAVLFREIIYLFDTEECLVKFMRHPYDYCSKTINFKGTMYPSLHYKELPIPGYLQQYDARQLIKAIVNTGILRPVVPCLSIEVSASLNIALFLKLKNPKTPEKFLPLYKEAQTKYNDMRNDLITGLAQLKKMINPYIYYDEPLPKFVDPLFGELDPSVDGEEGEKSCIKKLPWKRERRLFKPTPSDTSKLVRFPERTLSQTN